MSEWHIRFGTAGTSDSFEAKGYKSSLDIPAYTAEMGLDAFEYQCGHGVRLGVDKAGKMAADAAERGILFSVHAPYYISMSSLEEEKRLGSVRYLLQSAEVCRALGGKRIIFHSGSCGKQSREAALEKALDTMRRAVEALDEAGYGDMTLCPETMGKIGQLGTLDEVLALCGVDKRITPCIDFGHLNARTLGGIQSRADYAAILDRMGEVLGDERLPLDMYTRSLYLDRGPYKEMMEYIQSQLSQIGIDATVNVIDSSTYSEMSKAGELGANFMTHGMSNLNAYHFLDIYMSSEGSYNKSQHLAYSNPHVDELLAEMKTTLDDDRFHELAVELQEIANTELPVIPLFYDTSNLIYNQEQITGYEDFSDHLDLSHLSWVNAQ